MFGLLTQKDYIENTKKVYYHCIFPKINRIKPEPLLQKNQSVRV